MIKISFEISESEDGKLHVQGGCDEHQMTPMEKGVAEYMREVFMAALNRVRDTREKAADDRRVTN